MAFRKMNDPEILRRLDAENAAAARLLDTRTRALNLLTEHHKVLSEREQLFCGTVRANLDVFGSIRGTEHAWLMAITERLQPGFIAAADAREAGATSQDQSVKASPAPGVDETASPGL